jgi:hypothetical protein
MKREARLLLQKATDSLMLSIELFNRPLDRGRVTGTLVLLDHAFEMLLKAAILQRGARIRDNRAKQTIGFDACVRRGLSDGRVKFLAEEQALVLQTINGLRDAAQHYLLDISEAQLYIHAQAGVTLFRDLLKAVFAQELAAHLPSRVLPISTAAPMDLTMLFDAEIAEVVKLLGPRRRRRVEAQARLRPLTILDGAIKGEIGQPSTADLTRIGQRLLTGTPWQDLFQGVSAVDIRTDGTGPSLSLRFSKKEGVPIHVVPEGTPGASVVAVRRVDELGYYQFGAKKLAAKLALTVPKLGALTDHLGIRRDLECYKEFKIDQSIYKRYSQKALTLIREALETIDVDEVWQKRRTLIQKTRS